MKRRAFLRVLAAAGAGAAVGGVSWGLHERLQISVTRETLRVTGLPAPFVGFRIAMLTDLHRSGLVALPPYPTHRQIALELHP